MSSDNRGVRRGMLSLSTRGRVDLANVRACWFTSTSEASGSEPSSIRRRLTRMLTRRQTLQTVGALGLVAPVLSACGDASSGTTRPDAAGLRLVSADVPRSAGDPAAVSGVVASMASFTRDLWGAVGGTDENLALSPYSIAVALAMTANGARGDTAHHMRDVLHVDSL